MQIHHADNGAATYFIQISSAHQFREALSRLRFLEGAAAESSLGRERAALELAMSRYLSATEVRSG